MNPSTSEHSSSGCESGWTTYLDQLSNSNSRGMFYTNYDQKGRFSYQSKQEDEDEDEDLSMVSDASSGPPYYAYNSSFSQEKNKKNGAKKLEIWPKNQTLCLDDTASSPVFNFSQNNVPPKHGHDGSEEAFPEGESITKKHLSFFKSSSKKGKSGSLLGRKRQ